MKLSTILNDLPNAEDLNKNQLFAVLETYINEILWVTSVEKYIKTVKKEIEKRDLKNEFRTHLKEVLKSA